MFWKPKPNYKLYSITFFAGALTGAVVALLYAPMTGRKMKGQIKEALDSSVENVQSIVRRVVNA
jgi:gas vesicle protein